MKRWTTAELETFENAVRSERPEIWDEYLQEEENSGDSTGIPGRIAMVFYQIAMRDFGHLKDKEDPAYLFAMLRDKYRNISP